MRAGFRTASRPLVHVFPFNAHHWHTERADEEAKRAAQGESSDWERLPRCLLKPLPVSVSKVRQIGLARIQDAARAVWLASPRHAKLARIDPTMPSKKFTILVAALPRRHASLLFQLRTGHIPLQQHLRHLRKTDSSLCPSCSQQPESVRHYLLECPTYQPQRAALVQEIGQAAHSIGTLLSNPKATRPLFKFIHATGRFAATYGRLEILDSEVTDSRPKRKGK